MQNSNPINCSNSKCLEGYGDDGRIPANFYPELCGSVKGKNGKWYCCPKCMNACASVAGRAFAALRTFLRESSQGVDRPK